MNFIDFIERPQRIDRAIRQTLQKAEIIKARLESSSQMFSPVVAQEPRHNKVEDNLIRLADYRRDVNSLMVEYDNAVDEVSSWLYENLTVKNAEILECKYCYGEDIKQITESLNIEYEAARQRLKRAKLKAQTIYERKQQQ